MPDPNHQSFERRSPPGRWRRLYHRHRESDTTLGIAIALIAMLFIAGIVTAFIHAADTNAVQTAQHAAKPPAAETTGSGGSSR
jgi:hypothetical protein